MLNVNNCACQKKHAIKGERNTMDLIITRRIYKITSIYQVKCHIQSKG